jgi:hypothetical protein
LLGGAYAAGRGLLALRRIVEMHTDGRIVACSHGDLIPALVVCIAAANEQDVPPPVQRGGWYHLRVTEPAISLSAVPPVPGFPL